MSITEITPINRAEREKIRLAGYCRVSRNTQDQLHSFAVQVRYFSEYTQNHPEYELVDVYADEGITGTEMEKRDELNRLIRDCKNGKIDRIIVKSASRFARNTVDWLTILRLLKEIGVSVYFEEQNIDTDKLNMEMIATFPGMAAQQESEAISGNLRWSYQKRMESGEFNCTCPAYGYDLINGEMVINETEAIVVQRIFNLYLQGMGLQAIASLFNEECVPRRYSRTHWHRNTIKYILTNERYIGDALLQKKYTTDTLPYRLKKNNGEKPQYYVENSHPPIINKEAFERVQELLKLKRNDLNQNDLRLLSGKIRCSCCGRTFRRQMVREKIYWCCQGQSTKEKDCMPGMRVKEEDVYEAFVDMTYKLKKYRQALLEPLIRQIELLQQKTSNIQEKIRQIDKDIADFAAKNLVIARLHTNGILNAAEYASKSSEIGNKINELRSERKKKLSENEEEQTLDELKELNEIIDNYKPKPQLDKELFEQIVGKIIVRKNMQITFCLLGGLELSEQIYRKGELKAL